MIPSSSIFSTHSLPDIIVQTMVQRFLEQSFQEFTKLNGNRPVKTAPSRQNGIVPPSTNGQAERAVKIFKEY